MKFYIASLLAFSDLEITGDTSEGAGQPGFLTMCIPAVIPAESIEGASEIAHAACLERWKPTEGWHTHQANIMVLTETFFDSFVEIYDSGKLDMSDETPRTFTWDPGSRLDVAGEFPL